MRKRVNYHPLNSISDPYGGKVYPLFVYQISSQIRSNVIRGPKIFEIGHVIQATPT